MINFIKIILLIIVINITTGCAPDRNINIDPEFLSYFQKFKSNSSKKGKPLDVKKLAIEMVPFLGQYTIGTCQPSIGIDAPLIKISKYFWDNFNENQKEATLFHEMGHCILNRGHRNDKNNNFPLSIMNAYLFISQLYVVNYEQYQHELFLNEDLNDALPLKLNSFMTSNYIESNELSQNSNSEFLTDEELKDIRCEDGVVYHHH